MRFVFPRFWTKVLAVGQDEHPRVPSLHRGKWGRAHTQALANWEIKKSTKTQLRVMKIQFHLSFVSQSCRVTKRTVRMVFFPRSCAAAAAVKWVIIPPSLPDCLCQHTAVRVWFWQGMQKFAGCRVQSLSDELLTPIVFRKANETAFLSQAIKKC